MRPGQSGFTLMEVLVAVIITGLTVTSFFQLFSSSMRLEMKGRKKLSAAFEARQKFEELILQDIKAEDFEWEGEIEEKPWELSLHPVELSDDDEYQAEEVQVKVTRDLYALKFSYFENGKDAPSLDFVLYKDYGPSELTEDFKSERVGEPLYDNLDGGS